MTFAKGGISVKKVFVVNDNIRDWCALAISGSPISCEFILEKSLPPIDADMDQISQIMNNLVINARQAMPNGGNLTIRTYSRIVNDAHPQKIEAGSYVAIEVQDTGIGIPDQILPVIFEPFFTTKIGSSGLGLATSLSIANKHGGCIEVVSVPGSGSTVTVLIPVAVPDISGTDHTKNFVLSAQNTPTTSAQKKQSVLVMDDDEFIREMAVQILNDAGYRAAGTKNGEETIAAYLKAQNNSNPFDMVILDLTIVGGMGGEETIAKLLKVNPEICAVVSSGYSNSLILSNPKKYGFCAVVSKPYHKLELIEAVNKVLKKRAKSN